MTPLAYLYLAVGLLSLVWPLVLLLVKRRVLGAQWMMASALILFGLSVILYSTFFNNFLKGEYLLVMLYMILSLTVPPVTQTASAALTRTQGVPLKARALVIPSLLVVLLMMLSVTIGGADMYRLWIDRGTDSLANHFYPHSWRYNLIVAIHFYLYLAVLVGEVVYVAVYVTVNIIRFHRILGEFYATGHHDTHIQRGIHLSVGICSLCLLFSCLAYPFNKPRPLWTAVVVCAVEAAAVFSIGRLTYRLSYGAEQLNEKLHTHRYQRGNFADLGKRIAQLVEREEGFLDPDLTVFTLSEKLRVPQDDVVDAIHKMHGTPFRDYVDSLRVERAASLLMADNAFNHDDPEQLSRLAHSCGYLDIDALQAAFDRAMQMSMKEWSSRNQ